MMDWRAVRPLWAWVGLALALVAAVAVGWASLVIGLQTRSPELIADAPLAPTALAQANREYRQLASQLARDPNALADKDMLARARAAYAREPLAAVALAVSARADGADPNAKQTVAALAGRLTRRLVLVNNQLFQNSIERGDLREGFAWLDRAARANREANNLYVEALVSAMAAPDSVEMMVPVLRAEPIWADSFWAAVPANTAALANAAQLREAMIKLSPARKAIGDNDRRLIEALVGAREFDAARRLGDRLLPKRAAVRNGAGVNLLRDPGLSMTADLPPLTWRLNNDIDTGAGVRGEGGVEAFAQPRASGVVLEQLVAGATGRVTVAMVGSDLPGVASPTRIIARLSCADQSQPQSSVTLRPRQSGQLVGVIEVADGGACRWHFLRIVVDNLNGDEGVDMTFREVALVPAKS